MSPVAWLVWVPGQSFSSVHNKKFIPVTEMTKVRLSGLAAFTSLKRLSNSSGSCEVATGPNIDKSST